VNGGSGALLCRKPDVADNAPTTPRRSSRVSKPNSRAVLVSAPVVRELRGAVRLHRFLGGLPLRAASQARQPAMRVRRRPHAAGGGAVSVAARCLWPRSAGGGALPVAAQCLWPRIARGRALPVPRIVCGRTLPVAAQCPCPRPARALPVPVPVPASASASASAHCLWPRTARGRALPVAAHCPCPRTARALHRAALRAWWTLCGRALLVAALTAPASRPSRGGKRGEEAVTRRQARRAGRHAAASEASRPSRGGKRGEQIVTQRQVASIPNVAITALADPISRDHDP
jgi:hypothetical protein